MGRYFGTDGVRGLANGDLTPELALGIAGAAARVLIGHDPAHRPVAVVGRDPRASGEMLEAAVVAGLAAAGADVLRVGVLPTPAVAFLTADFRADLGVVLSASHNPMPDNGIKLFARGGRKLPDEIEAEIEAGLRRRRRSVARPVGAAVGRVRDAAGARRIVTSIICARPCRSRWPACTSSSTARTARPRRVAPEAYRRAGARVTALAAEPDGLNINDGVGSTHIEELTKYVVAEGADLGIAHDGDADRCLAVDASGEIVDGDQILAMCALALRSAGQLRENTVVATVMSNLGFHQAMEQAGIDVVTTAVGDRYVLEALSSAGCPSAASRAGTSSSPTPRRPATGCSPRCTSWAAWRRPAAPLAELAVGRAAAAAGPAQRPGHGQGSGGCVALRSPRRSRAAKAELGDSGRILLRPSGTEQLVRVMVEAPTAVAGGAGRAARRGRRRGQ